MTLFKKSFSKIYFLILSLGLALPIKLLQAQGDYGLGTAASTSGIPQGDIPTFLGRFAGAALALSGSIFLFLIIYGGIIMMTSAGNTEKAKKGQSIIIWAVIGALVLGGAYAITQLVFSAFQ